MSFAGRATVLRKGDSIVATCLLTVAACATNDAADSYVAATLVSSDASIQSAVVDVLTQALPGRRITIAENAFVSSPVLTLEPPIIRRLEGDISLDRNLDAPETFRLFKRGEDCIIIHQRTTGEYPVPGAVCTEAR